METWYKFFSGLLSAIAALFAPIASLMLTTLFFIGVDFITGVAADRKEAQRNHQTWYFESHKAWHTIIKLLLALTTILMAWLLDHYVLDFMNLNFSRLFTGFICGVEFWSFLENSSQLSEAPLFKWLRHYAHRRLKQEISLHDEFFHR